MITQSAPRGSLTHSRTALDAWKFVRSDQVNLAIFEPAPGKLLCERLPEERESDLGIELPQNAVIESQLGIVVKTDGDCKAFAVGDIVFWQPAAGQKIQLNGIEYHLIQWSGDELETEILAYIPSAKWVEQDEGLDFAPIEQENNGKVVSTP